MSALTPSPYSFARLIAAERVAEQRGLVRELESGLRTERRRLRDLEAALEAFDHGAQLTVDDIYAASGEDRRLAAA